MTRSISGNHSYIYVVLALAIPGRVAANVFIEIDGVLGIGLAVEADCDDRAACCHLQYRVILIIVFAYIYIADIIGIHAVAPQVNPKVVVGMDLDIY